LSIGNKDFERVNLAMNISDTRQYRKSLRVFILLPVIFLIVTCLTSTVRITYASNAEDTSRPKIGLVLSGGGARGAAHVGVLKVL
jgi:hypothetical protein